MLLVALDAMEITFLEALFAEGRLPNLRQFAEGAARVEVKSMGAELHGSLWPTFASSTEPGWHGVYWWTQWLAEEMRHVRNSHEAFAYEPFWGALARAGIRSCVIDVPYAPMVEAPEVRQFVGWGIHDEVVTTSWPGAFAGEVRKRFGKHPLSFDTVEPQSHKEKQQMVRDLRKGVAMRAKLIEGLLRDGRDDLVLLTFGETHKAGHYLAVSEEIGAGVTNVAAIGNVLEPLDEAWPQILEAAGPDCHVMLFALHGMVPQVDYSHGLAGQLLALANGHEPESGVVAPDLLRRVRNLVPDSVHRAIWKRLPARIRAAREGSRVEATGDYARDRLIKVGHDGSLGARMNLHGRERDGVVDEAEGEAAMTALWELARDYTVADGREAFGGLWRSKDEAPGPRSHRLPDALLLTNSEVERTDRLVGQDGRVLVSDAEEARNGVHTGTGFCFFRAAAGSAAAPARDLWKVVDFAPTLFELAGVPALDSFQGRSGLK